MQRIAFAGVFHRLAQQFGGGRGDGDRGRRAVRRGQAQHGVEFAAGATYAHVDVLRDPEIREGIKAYGDWPTIPQLYVGGELLGGSDIILQMAASGELNTVLGLPAPDRTPPAITITPAAAELLR
ncbi:MAG: hypothetical protein EOP93_18060, partial [Lysobacteraceae bacterium]